MVLGGSYEERCLQGKRERRIASENSLSVAALLAFLFYLAAAVVMLQPMTSHLGNALPAPCEDPLLNCWILAWDLRHLFEGWHGYWNGNIYFPCDLTLAYSENLLGFLPLAAPLWLINGNIVWVVNVLALLSFPLSGLGMYLLVHRLSGNIAAAFFAGLFFAFAPYRSLHFYHLNLLTAQWFPFTLLFWHESLTRGGLRSNLLFAFFLALHCLSSVHYGLFLILVLPPATVLFVRRNRLPETPARLRALAASFLPVLLLLAPLYYPYSLVQKELGIINLPNPHWSASLLSFITAPPRNHLWGWTFPLWGKSECHETTLFPGLLILIFSIAAVRALFPGGTQREIRAHLKIGPVTARWLFHRLLEVLIGTVLVMILCIAVTGGGDFYFGSLHIGARTVTIPSSILLFLLCLRVLAVKGILRKAAAALAPLGGEHLALLAMLAVGLFFSFYGPFLLLGKVVPVFFSMRVPARLFILPLIALSIYGGLGIAGVLGKMRSPLAKGALFFILTAGVLAEFACAPVLLDDVAPAIPGGIPRVYEWLKDQKDGEVVFELPSRPVVTQKAMLFSTYHRKKLVDGASGIAPRYMEDLQLIMNTLPSRASLTALSDFRVDFLLIHTKLLLEEEKARLGDLRGNKALSFVGDSDGTQVYRPLRERLPRSTAFEPPGPPIPRHGWKIKAPTLKGFFESGESAIDGNLVTYWSTNRAGQGGDSFVLDMCAEREVTGLGIFLGTDFRNWPRGYVIHVSGDEKTWREAARDSAFYPPFRSFFREPKNPYFVVPFGPLKCRYVRMTLTRNSPFPWGAHEIELYGR
jgi:hypothetical protein